MAMRNLSIFVLAGVISATLFLGIALAAPTAVRLLFAITGHHPLMFMPAFLMFMMLLVSGRQKHLPRR